MDNATIYELLSTYRDLTRSTHCLRLSPYGIPRELGLTPREEEEG